MIDKKLLSQIHAKFRSLRNGEVADLLCKYGVRYHLAFGVQSYQIRQIAESLCMEHPEITEDEAYGAELAETLWAEDIRESKMLATRLYPQAVMTPETALRWAQEAPYHEITDQLVMNILARLPYAETLLPQLPEYAAGMLRKRLEP